MHNRVMIFNLPPLPIFQIISFIFKDYHSLNNKSYFQFADIKNNIQIEPMNFNFNQIAPIPLKLDQ